MKKAFQCLVVISVFLLIYSAVVQIRHGFYHQLGYLALTIATSLIAPSAVHLFKLKNSWGILFWVQLFITVSMIWGHTLNGYALMGFDKVLHFSSGVMICYGITGFYCWMKKQWKETTMRDFILKCISIQGINMMIAFLWEVFEFACLVFFDIDAINHYTQGVYDTMTDMIVCFLGGCLFLWLLWRHQRKNKKNILITSLEEFYLSNFNENC